MNANTVSMILWFCPQTPQPSRVEIHNSEGVSVIVAAETPELDLAQLTIESLGQGATVRIGCDDLILAHEAGIPVSHPRVVWGE